MISIASSNSLRYRSTRRRRSQDSVRRYSDGAQAIIKMSTGAEKVPQTGSDEAFGLDSEARFALASE
jgi:hypothetical protein